MRENIKLSLQGIWSHKMRSMLTMLGIIIGIASIIAIVSTIRGNSEMIKESLIGSNNNVVTVNLYEGEWTYDIQYSGNPDGIMPLEDSFKEELEAIDTVDTVSFYNARESSDSSIYRLGTAFTGGIYGIDQTYFSLYNYQVTYGRSLLQSDFDNFRKVVVLDSTAASSLFPQENPIGQVVEISGEPFTVVGVVSQQKTVDLNITSVSDYYTYSDTSSGKMFVAGTVWPMIYRFDEIQNVAVKAVDTDSMTKAGKAVADAINEKLGLTSESTYQFQSQDLLKQAEQLQSMSNATNQQLIWIAGISLLVGGIGVMNIMLVTVTERTQEIGLKKAIGAKKKVILGQFLTEAAVLTSFGGILGVIFGIVVAKLLSQIMGIPTAISVASMIIAVLFSMCIGLVFGYLPARKAANLNPIDALRSE
jgi:putative ABC transport system permease protein